MSKLVLVRPGFSVRAERHWGTVPPLGLGYLAASCRKAGIEVAVIDGKLEGHSNTDQTVRAVIQHNPSWVGVSAMTPEFPLARNIAAGLKELDPEINMILGGIHATALSAQAMEEAREYDYLLTGEAEQSLPKLVANNCQTPETINGLFFRRKGVVYGNSSSKFDVDPALLPYPAWDLFPRSNIYPVLSERGCPFECVFCSHNSGKKLRSRPVEHVIEEIKWLACDFNPQEIWFQDETFGLNTSRTVDLLERLTGINQHKKIKFRAQTRVDCVDQEMVSLMRTAGFEYLEMGVESGDPGILAASGKRTNLEQVEKSVEIARKGGLKVWLKFIVGLPGETPATVKRSIQLAVKLNPHRLSVATIVAYPGSLVFEWALKGLKGYRLLGSNWATFDKYLANSIELDTLSFRALRWLQLRMYAETYLRNGRWLELHQLVSGNFSLAVKMLLGIFRK